MFLAELLWTNGFSSASLSSYAEIQDEQAALLYDMSFLRQRERAREMGEAMVLKVAGGT